MIKSSAGVPKLPPTCTRFPAVAAISASIVVTVLLPFEPVIAITGALA